MWAQPRKGLANNVLYLWRSAGCRCRLLGPVGALADGPDAGVQATEIFARCLTIAGGTSEIVRSTIGERLLGLPREPDPWHDRPWREVPRS